MKKKNIWLIVFIALANFTSLLVNARTSEPASPLKVNADRIKNYQGVYLSANDFTNGRVSFVNNQSSKKYKFYSHDFFNTSTVKIVVGDSVIMLNKNLIFGYRDKRNTCYRFYNKTAYKIINPSEKILLYSRTSMVGNLKNSHNVTYYYFSENANSPIYPLSKWNLKAELFNNVSFIRLLEVYFRNDAELLEYDSNNKVYFLNRVYALSDKKIISNN
jgi:hypothetical protein